MWNLKYDTNKLMYKMETGSQTKQTNGYQSGKKGGGINEEFEINIYTLLHVKQTTNKDLLSNTEDYAQYFIISYKGKESEKEQIYT